MKRNNAIVPTPVPMSLWDRDHWSTLLYVETVCVDHDGQLERRRMRVDRRLHPLLAHIEKDQDSTCPTRLANGVELDRHDDYNCLEDMEVVGLLEVVSSINGLVRLTDLGWKVAAAARKFRAEKRPWEQFDAASLMTEAPAYSQEKATVS